MGDIIRIAIDGPSGAGKSTIAKAVAKKLGFDYIDTGAMYRAVGYKMTRDGIAADDTEKLKEMLQHTEIDFSNGVISLDGEDVSGKIRTPEMSTAASMCSAIPMVREKLVEEQRAMGRKKSVVMDGRDIGTNVFTDAQFKFFLTATAEERAKRRCLELKEKGEDVNFEDTLKDIEQRDYNDSHRALNPLRKADDAIEVDTTSMIADIGGGTSDIAIIALGGIVAATSIRYAGDKFNEAIIQYMRKRHALLIGERTAEQLKIKVGCASIDLDENGDEIIESVKASGRDIISGLPKTIDVTNRDMMMALQESIEIVVDGIKSTIEKAPPEIAADIANTGMMISGGGGLIHNLDKMVEKRTGMKVQTAENAFEAVAAGTGMSLNDIDKLKVYANTIHRG